MNARVLRGLEGLPPDAHGRVLTIGIFDGVHLGHQRILQTARALADRAGGQVCVGTFDPSPAELLAPDRPAESILTSEVKYRLLGECGADFIVVIETTGELLATPAEGFVRDVILGRLRGTHVVEGPDFRFGRGRAGSVETLRRMAAKSGFEFTEVAAAKVELPGKGAVRVSSSLIRDLVRSGEVEAAGGCLTRPFTLYGRVVTGQRRGRLLQFPTANVDPDKTVVPGDGVYAARVEIGPTRYPSAVSIGVKPTFGPARRSIEVHLIDADGDFYGRRIAVAFLARLRDQAKFSDADSLRVEIAKDIQRVREIYR